MDTSTSELSDEVPLAPTKRPFAFADVPWQWGDILLGFAPLILTRAVSVMITREWMISIPTWVWIPLTAANTIWLLTFPLVMGRRRPGTYPRFSERPSFRTIGLEVLIALCSIPLIWMVLFSCIVVVVVVSGKPPTPELPLAPIAGSPNPWDRIALVLLAVCVAPIAEECFFRGMLFNKLRSHMSAFLAVPLQAVIFGLVHPFGPLQISLISVIGIGLGVIYLWRKTIITSMLVHAFQNGAAMTLMLLYLTLMSNGPWLGVGGEAGDEGYVIKQLVPDGPAAKAGLQIGDTITTLDGKAVTNTGSLMQIVLVHKAGDRVTAAYVRAGVKGQLEVILEKRTPK